MWLVLITKEVVNMATAKNVKPTKKNSPSIHLGANRDNGPAEMYAKNGASVAAGEAPMKSGILSRTRSAQDASITDPLSNGVSYGIGREKTDGIVMRGHGAAIKGIKSRGPMA